MAQLVSLGHPTPVASTPSDDGPPAGLRADGVRIGYYIERRRQFQMAVDDVTFAAARGQFVSVVGASGCGKSSFLKAVGGLVEPVSGSLTIEGRQVRGPGRDRAIVFQDAALLPWRTAVDNVSYGLYLSGVRRAAARRRATEMLALVGLAGHDDQYPHELSGGMRQRVNLARALVVDPSVLLMDEPLSALDAQTRIVMQDEVQRIWNETGKTVLFVTHDIEEAVYLSDVVVVLGGRPSTVVATVDVPIERPRAREQRRLPEFTATVDAIWERIRADVMRAV